MINILPFSFIANTYYEYSVITKQQQVVNIFIYVVFCWIESVKAKSHIY